MLACIPPGLSCHLQTLNGPHQDSSVQNEEAVGLEPYIFDDQESNLPGDFSQCLTENSSIVVPLFILPTNSQEDGKFSRNSPKKTLPRTRKQPRSNPPTPIEAKVSVKTCECAAPRPIDGAKTNMVSQAKG